MLKREKLKNFRLQHKLTQQEIAEKLKISLVQYQYIETGRRNPSFKLLENFKKAFPKINIDKIFLS